MRMHLVTEPPGCWFETLHIEEPASLSLTNTVPAAYVFPPFPVVFENAAYVPAPATTATTATTSADHNMRRPGFTRSLRPRSSGTRSSTARWRPPTPGRR